MSDRREVQDYLFDILQAIEDIGLIRSGCRSTRSGKTEKRSEP